MRKTDAGVQDLGSMKIHLWFGLIFPFSVFNLLAYLHRNFFLWGSYFFSAVFFSSPLLLEVVNG
jgi:hypothetical protein